ncbi:uncharacterized protein BO95DRAFT_505790 [Aspergillus brunneoviolaceus CBS 621.78]|uniref:Uncharacterized protein n=1 Tax=Aspergillus brunneoviolaceus CBS 621.78 TaxID=1450534 RepID=A0ACD1FY06_9EURO|nr:hypothetical protein BO95DRAFT_505790 [Aspergillus brunneoviolaceus CBS 621.78]RAH41860.1 hypothetical protein BO95DRAFT_505790 [Aspergillus brunneoviolaceus CBS 621.78]
MLITTRRRLADTPIIPKIFFCLYCLRTNIKNFDITNAENFVPGCVFDAVVSVACKQYSSRNQVCYQDLDWDLTLCVQVGYLTLVLATGFEAAELAHRREYGLTGISKSKVTVFFEGIYRKVYIIYGDEAFPQGFRI